MPLYRKKPVVIEAFQMTIKRMENDVDWPKWLIAARDLDTDKRNSLFLDVHNNMRIMTLEGAHFVTPGDFIIQGVQGELYPCKPDIFHATYNPVVMTQEDNDATTK